jgi:hypothetical protein
LQSLYYAQNAFREVSERVKFDLHNPYSWNFSNIQGFFFRILLSLGFYLLGTSSTSSSSTKPKQLSSIESERKKMDSQQMDKIIGGLYKQFPSTKTNM